MLIFFSGLLHRLYQSKCDSNMIFQEYNKFLAFQTSQKTISWLRKIAIFFTDLFYFNFSRFRTSDFTILLYEKLSIF